MIQLKGKVALVTGGSRGIGRAACLLLARAGADLVFGFRQDEAAARLLVEEIEQMGRRARAVGGDVARRQTLVDLFEAAGELGGVDIAVGNAGIWRRAPIDEMDEAEWSRMIEVNLTSIYHLCHLAAREMKARGGGAIVLLSSTAAQRGEAFHAHYAASKGAVIALTKSLAAELGPSGIRVNAVAPGWVDTDMCREVFADPQFREQVRRDIPLQRIPGPEEIASAILYLASDLARHVNGEILNVNGGSVLCG